MKADTIENSQLLKNSMIKIKLIQIFMKPCHKNNHILRKVVTQPSFKARIEIMLGIKNNMMLLMKNLGTMKPKKALKDIPII
jgi:hypothetical protein